VEERVRLEQKERRRRAQAEILRDTAAAIARSLQLDDVIEQALRGVEQLFDHKRSRVALYDIDGVLELAGQRVPGGVVDEFEPHTPVPDLSSDASRPRPADERPSPHLADDGTVILPLQVADRLLGFLAVEPNADADFGAEELGLLATIADQAASAISNSRALVMARSMAAIQERQRLANDLHDSVSQTLWTASLVAETLARSANLTAEEAGQVGRLRLLTTGALSEMRTLLLELRPNVIEETPLADLIHQLASAFESRKSASCTVELDPGPELVPTVKVALYRIVQESLNNVARHAEATAVEIALKRGSDRLCLLVRDDGVGFDTGRPPEHMGQRIMAERAKEIGADLTVCSTVGKGTTVTVAVKVVANDLAGWPP
jgi:signal transduction histidine kinase